MGILGSWLGGREVDEEMARTKAKAGDAARIEQLADELKLAVKDAAAFKAAFAQLAEDEGLAAADIIAVAHRFVGGRKPTSRKAALKAIAQERVRVSHAMAKAATASKVRSW
jgi:hypothetical protein